MTDPASREEDAVRPPGRVRSVPVPDGRVRMRVRGDGPPLLCLHGVSAHGGVWRRVSARLEDAFRLHVPDLLGRGGSEARPDVSYRLEREVARAAELAAGLPDRGYLVAGHSQGAALAVVLAARAARDDGATVPRPAGLVLLAPVTPWTRRPLLLEALRFRPVRSAVAAALRPARRPLTRWVLEHRAFGDPGLVDAEAVRRWAAPWSEARRARTLLRVLADWRPTDLSGHLPDVLPPCRVVAGGMDRRIGPAQARRWAARLGASFAVARDAGHMVPVERPGVAADAARRVAEDAGVTR